MAIHLIKDAQYYMGKYDISGNNNQVSLTYEGDEVDSTCMNEDGARAFLAGLVVSRAQINGYVDYAENALDSALFGKIGLNRVPLTVGPETGDDGAIAFFVQANSATYEPGATVGEMMAYSGSAVGTDSRLIRGKIMATGLKTTSTVGVARELGDVSATQKVYAALHVFSASGTIPTLDVKVASDAVEAFTTAPSDRITFDQIDDTLGYEFKTLDGPITDEWWRVEWTLGGTDPEFSFVVVVGIS